MRLQRYSSERALRECAPKMAPHIPEMVKNIASDLGVASDHINVKATTNEKLGHLGRGEGIAVQAIALIRKS